MTSYLIGLLAYCQFSILLAFIACNLITDAWPQLRA